MPKANPYCLLAKEYLPYAAGISFIDQVRTVTILVERRKLCLFFLFLIRKIGSKNHDKGKLTQMSGYQRENQGRGPGVEEKHAVFHLYPSRST